MSNLAGIILVLLIFSPFIVIVVWAFRYQKKIYRRSWDFILDLLDRSGAKRTTTVPDDRSVMLSLNAAWKGHSIEIWNEFTGSGKSKRLVTRCEFKMRDLNLPEFNVYRENALTRFGDKLGIKDIKTGSTEFDNAFRLNGKDEKAVLAFFDLNAQELFLQNHKDFYGYLTAKGNSVVLEVHGSPGHKIYQRHFTCLFNLATEIISEKGKLGGFTPHAAPI